MMKNPNGHVLLAGQTFKVPCGVIFISVLPTEGTEGFDMQMPGGTVLEAIKVPFTYAFPSPLESKTADPWNVVAKEKVNIFYVR